MALNTQEQIRQLNEQLQLLQAQLSVLQAQAEKEQEALETPPALQPDNQPAQTAASSIDTQQEKSQKMLQELAAIKDADQRALAIQERADQAAAVTGVAAEKLQADLTGKVNAVIAENEQKPPSLYVTQFNSKPGEGQVSGGVTVDSHGVTGASVGGQTGAFASEKYGAGSVFANLGMNAAGDVNGAGIGVKYVSPAFKTPDLTGVGIAAVSANVPLDGSKEFDAGNLNATIGTAIWNKDGVSSITTLSTDGKGSKLVGSEDISYNAYQTGDTAVAVHGNASHDFLNDVTSVGGGVIGKTTVAPGVEPWASVDASMQDVGGANDPAVMFQVGVNIGGAPAPSVSTRSEHVQTNIVVASNTAVPFNSISATDSTSTSVSKVDANHSTAAVVPPAPVKKNEEDPLADIRKAYEGLKTDNERNRFLDQVAHNFSKNYGADQAAARDYLVEELAERHAEAPESMQHERS